MRTLRFPPVITVNKSAVYALYALTYIRDVAYKPEEFYVQTRKCEPDAGADVVMNCESQPVVLVGTSVGFRHDVETSDSAYSFVVDPLIYEICNDKLRYAMWSVVGKAALLEVSQKFHVFGIGQRSVGFSIRIEVKTASKISDVIVGLGNRTVTSNDNFLRANLIGDYVGYTNIPLFEDYYLVIPSLSYVQLSIFLNLSLFDSWEGLTRSRSPVRLPVGMRRHALTMGATLVCPLTANRICSLSQCLSTGGPGQPQNLGRNFSMWMLIERVRFTLDGLECNKIGVGYDAFNGQLDFCSSQFWSCLHNQLWNFWEADMNRISRKQSPLYVVQERFERINQHPNSGSHSFSIGITEVLNTNLLIELSADDIEYVNQRSPGKILSITVPTFEALTQFGTATITTKNIGEVEASYSLTVSPMNLSYSLTEQYYIMKPKEITTRSFKLYPTTDQAAKYVCAAILKDSGFSEVDRAECQFTTTTTVIENGSQIPFQPPKTSIHGFFESIEILWKTSGMVWQTFSLAILAEGNALGFSTSAATYSIFWLCYSRFYIKKGSLILFVTGGKIIFRLMNKELVICGSIDIMLMFREYIKRNITSCKEGVIYDTQKKRRSFHTEQRHDHSELDTDYYYYLHHVHKDKHKHGKTKGTRIMRQMY
ncbi:hypothetical protein ACSBR2_041068 [Camellia fascicularis]